MTGFWKTIIIIGISVLLIATGFFGYRHYRALKDPALKAMDAVTINSLVFAEINSPLKVFKKFTKENELLNELSNIPVFANLNKNILYFDSVLSTDPFASSVLKTTSYFISVNQTNSGSYASIFWNCPVPVHILKLNHS
ncbi:MAG: hypothetical protein R2764_09790 [Bacteroidales bacterium]